MGTSNFSLLKAMTMVLAVVAVMALSHSMAKADEVTIAGYTNGCFGAACVPANGSAYGTASLLGLTYGNSTFSNTTVGGFLAYGGNPQVVPGPQNVNNLGSFTLASTANTYSGSSFTLRVTFTLPTGINGSNTTLFTATLTGAVSNTGNGGVMLDFNNTPILFTFSNASGSGSFMFAVNDLSIKPGQTAEITGQVTSAQQSAVPEPVSMLLLGTGLVGVAGAARWRFKGRS